MPGTGVGTRWLVVVPSPSWPQEFDPQHNKPPPFMMAQECAVPTETSAAPAPMPVTGTGTALEADKPLPSKPALLPPQQRSASPRVIAHDVFRPTETVVTPDVSPETGTGMLLGVCVPFPSCPKSFSPQHCTPPPGSTAHAW